MSGNASTAERKPTTALIDGLAVLLFAGALVVGGYFLYQTMSAPPVTVSELTEQADQPDAVAGAVPAVKETVSFDVYAPIFNNRDIFKTDEERVIEAAEQPVVDASAVVSWAAEYELVGVIIDNAPQAVVKKISEPGVQFLSIGDHLGDAVLQSVEENQALFLYHGQEVRLDFKQSAQAGP